MRIWHPINVFWGSPMTSLSLRVSSASAEETDEIMAAIRNVANELGLDVQVQVPDGEDKHLFDGASLLMALLSGLANVTAGVLGNAIYTALTQRLSRPEADIVRKSDGNRSELRDDSTGAQVIIEEKKDGEH